MQNVLSVNLVRDAGELEHFIEKWNTRPLEDAKDKQIEALKEQLEYMSKCYWDMQEIDEENEEEILDLTELVKHCIGYLPEAVKELVVAKLKTITEGE